MSLYCRGMAQSCYPLPHPFQDFLFLFSPFSKESLKYNIVGMLCNTVRTLSTKIVQKLELAAKIGVTRKPRCASAPNGRAATPPRTRPPPPLRRLHQPAAGGAADEGPSACRRRSKGARAARVSWRAAESSAREKAEREREREARLRWIEGE